jgi:hypothetical protein
MDVKEFAMEKKKKRPVFKVIVVEFNNTADAYKDAKTLKTIGAELEAAVNEMRREGYTFQLNDYPKGILIMGERVKKEPHPLAALLGARLRKKKVEEEPPPEDLRLSPEHSILMTKMLEGMAHIPPTESPVVLQGLVASLTKGIPAEGIQTMIAAYEKFAAAHEKTAHAEACAMVPQIRQLVSVLKQQVQLQIS